VDIVVAQAGDGVIASRRAFLSRSRASPEQIEQVLDAGGLAASM
jgi:hypothetical protein